MVHPSVKYRDSNPSGDTQGLRCQHNREKQARVGDCTQPEEHSGTRVEQSAFKRLCSVQTSQMRMVTVQRCQTSGSQRYLLELRGASITQHPTTTNETKPPRGGAVAGGNHEQKKKQSRVPQKKSRTTTRQTPLPLVQQSTRHRSRPPHPIRPRRRRHRTRPCLQAMQLKKRRTIRQRQPNSTSTRQSRTPRT